MRHFIHWFRLTYTLYYRLKGTLVLIFNKTILTKHHTKDHHYLMSKSSAVFDLGRHLAVLVTVTAVLQLNLFGTLGLIVYGVLYTYSFITIIVNYIRGQKLYIHPMLIAVSLYYLHYMVCVTVNGYFMVGFTPLLQLFLLTVACFFVRRNDDYVSDFSYMSKVLTIMGLVMAGLSLFISHIYYNHYDFVSVLPECIKAIIDFAGPIPPNGRLSGLLSGPNATALYSSVCAMFALYLFFSMNTGTGWKITACANILTALYIIFIRTSSRTSMLSILAFLFLFIALFYLVLSKNKKRNLIIFFCSIAICFSLIAFMFYTNESFHQIVSKHILRTESLSTGSGRLKLYEAAYELGKGNRLFGISRQALVDATGDPNALHAHNLILQLLTFTGIPGLILYCAYIFTSTWFAIQNLYRVQDNKLKLLCIFIVCFIFAYYINGITEYGSLDRLRMLSLCAQVVFAYPYMIRYNLQKSAKTVQKNSMASKN